MSNIQYESADGIAVITLNRPEKLNAMFGTMREELAEAFERAGGDREVRVVILTGAGRGFCAGGDVEAMQQMQREARTDDFQTLLDAGKKIVTTIRNLPKLVIAAVNGVAAGAGCNLALACDYRLAAETAKFSESFVRIGLHPDWGGTYFLPRLVGASRALELLVSGRMVSADEALKIGLVDRLVPTEELMTEARKFAGAIAAAPPIPVAAMKRAVYASSANSLEQQVDLESRNQQEAFASADSAEGMAAFFEKRTPVFTGK
jgi:2-(1,2-epoxy-1,2-dihydrophenyl)acetyl-CoA isomerase